MNRQLFRHQATRSPPLRPGIKARVEHEAGGYLLWTNREVPRCRHAFEKKRAPGKFRVLLFGDSYTAGDGVSDRFRYGDVLESLIPGLEVYNFGLSGSGTDQQYLIWREIAREIEHDLVVIGVLVENIRRIVARYRPYETPDGKPVLLAKPYFTLERSGDLSLHNVPVPREPLTESELAGDGAAHVDRGGRFEGLRRLVAKLRAGREGAAPALDARYPPPAYDRPNDPGWLLAKAILTRCRRARCRAPVICPIPLYQYIEETASPKAYQALPELTRRPGPDPRPARGFSPSSRAERRTYRVRGRLPLTPSAHEVLARSAARTIEP
ncbi:MAG: SGNH/GDSL hydrolase family protein [Deltaproteobacteria bacterium]|nr:SGNH/GDSL hydrolase family protein [Deltaproteobacteria bacterium]